MDRAAPDTLVFDLYGTLVDPASMVGALQRCMPEASAASVAQLWRAAQVDYSFRLTIMEQYHDFERVTAAALECALGTAGYPLSPADRDAVLAQYNMLQPFADVLPGLRSLSEKGLKMVVLSNGSPTMIAACLQRAELERYFDLWISVHDVGLYKPHRRVYQHAATVLHRPAGSIRLVSSNPFDVAGAANAGMKTVWINRGERPFDPLFAPPDLVSASLVDLSLVI